MQVEAYLTASMGPEALQFACSRMTVPPLQCCLRVNRLKSSREAVMDDLRAAFADSPSTDVFFPRPHPVLDNVVMVAGFGPRDIDFDRPGAGTHHRPGRNTQNSEITEPARARH